MTHNKNWVTRFLFIFPIVCLCLFVLPQQHEAKVYAKKEAPKEKLLLNRSFHLEATSKHHKLKLNRKEKASLYGVKDQVYYLDIMNEAEERVGVAQVTLRKVPTKDLFVFVHVDSQINDVSLTLEQNFRGDTYQKLELDRPTSEVYPNRKRYTDPTTNRFTYFEYHRNSVDEVGSVFIGGQYTFKTLRHTYRNTRKTSTVYELIAEHRNIKNKKTNEGFVLSVTTNAHKDSGESWYVLSHKPLFNSAKEFDVAQKIGIDEYKWLTPTEVKSKAVATIYPASEKGFVRSLVRQSAKKSIIAYEKLNNRFFEDINWNSFVQLESIRDEDGLWYTNYTSTWLDEKYGITTHYVDSRHNDNIFRAQDRRARNLKITEYKDNYKLYGDFLVEKMQEGYVMKTSKGKFLVDYFSEFSNELPHVSLNHGVSLANYLYYAYQKSSDDKYATAANEILQALNDTGEAWINPKGNVYYQLNQDGTFQSEDYKIVTYYDLLYTKRLLQEMNNETNSVIETLIRVKEENLATNGIKYEVDIKKIEDYVGIIE
ncbi:hypothetical protein [Bacillus timonensis]|uniref:hypothetical protein n=1 Tax=Bacillus timonensis TaxID=1033734 RepID=UPI000288C20D|nr:hypothetical protein [Bacillus timonensis]